MANTLQELEADLVVAVVQAPKVEAEAKTMYKRLAEYKYKLAMVESDEAWVTAWVKGEIKRIEAEMTKLEQGK